VLRPACRAAISISGMFPSNIALFNPRLDGSVPAISNLNDRCASNSSRQLIASNGSEVNRRDEVRRMLDGSPVRFAAGGLFRHCPAPERAYGALARACPLAQSRGLYGVTMAAEVVEQLNDLSAPEGEQQKRKRRLIHGPREFREIRQDQHRERVPGSKAKR
jgi:hypothetical protein